MTCMLHRPERYHLHHRGCQHHRGGLYLDSMDCQEFESGERLLEMRAEQELVVGNRWMKKMDVYKYTWLRMAEGRN